jgi:hypothetical protein
MSRFYMGFNFQLQALLNQPLIPIRLSDNPPATVVLDSAVPPKRLPASSSVCPATTHRPQLIHRSSNFKTRTCGEILVWGPATDNPMPNPFAASGSIKSSESTSLPASQTIPRRAWRAWKYFAMPSLVGRLIRVSEILSCR